MSRLQQRYHIDFKRYPDFERAWANTPTINLGGWEKIAENNRVSTYAMMWSLYRVWVTQLNDLKTVNFLYIEWLFRTTKMMWPLGSLWIPDAALGRAKCGWATLGLNNENALL